MGLAVCTMHYVGMTAATMVCTAAAPASSMLIGGRYIGLVVFGVAGAVLIVIAWIVSERSIAATAESIREDGGAGLGKRTRWA